MNIKFNEIEKVWSVPDNEIDNNNYCGLGQAILTKLNDDNPERVLEVFYDKQIQSTVGDIRRQTINVAMNLQRMGLKEGDTVVLYSMSNEKVTPIAFACYTIGAPINFFETNFERGEISHFLQLIDPTIIIYEEKYRTRLFTALEILNLRNLKHTLSLGSMTPSVDEVLFAECGNIESFQPPQIKDPTTHPATLMLTSGTTGLPKIIMHSHAVMIHGLYSWWHPEPEDIAFCFSPVRWISQVAMMLQPVFFGSQRFFSSQQPSGILGKQIIDTCKITYFFTVPAMYSAILRAAESSEDSCSLSSLKVALVGGEVVMDVLLERMSQAIPNCKAVKCYGMTESAGMISLSDEEIRKKSPHGMALTSGYMAKIIDDASKPLGSNEMGQLCLKRTTLPYLKYLKNDKANIESFLEGGWMNTGDYAFMDSNNLLHIVTRYKDLVRCEGNIIIPNTVEKHLGSHPSVQVAVLVGHPNPDEPNDEIGTVFVVLRSGMVSRNIENELKEHMQMICTKEEVKAVRHFKVLSEMPLTSCGKIDRSALKKLVCATC